MIEEREGSVRVGGDEPLGCRGHNLGLEGALHVGAIDLGPDALVKIRVAHDLGKAALVQKVDELGVHAALGQREKRVEDDPAGLGDVDDGAAIGPPLLLVLRGASCRETRA